MKKIISLVMIYTFLMIIVIPSVVTYFYGFDTGEVIDNGDDKYIFQEGNQIKVLNPETEEVVETPFEDYIKGVVGAEMPALFEEEALKAQAVAARTYAVKKMEETQTEEGREEVPYNIGQAYLTKEELKKRWGIHFDEYYKRVSEAVDATKDEIIVYNSEPILAVFHSTSAGITETAENVWGQDLPYLKSVDSHGDEDAPDFEAETIMSTSTVIGKLQSKYTDLILTEGSLMEQMQIVERTEAGYIKQIQIGNKMFTGKQVREALGLRSSNFTITKNGDNIKFVTKGFGHGAGMSQYGANFMAKEGFSYIEILKHYYQNIEIEKK